MSIKSFTNGGLTGSKFNSIGASITEPLNDMDMFVWVQAGGGGGGGLKLHSGWGNFFGAGGGAGGLVYGSGVIFLKNTNYAATIGAGGSAEASGSNTTLAYNGGTITSLGGGRGGHGSQNYDGNGAENGGCGGGGGTVFANVAQDGNGYNGGQGLQDTQTGHPTGFTTTGFDGGKGNRGANGATPGRSGGTGSGGTYNVNSYGNGAGTSVLSLVDIGKGGSGSTVNLGHGGSERGAGGSGMIYIIHSQDISVTVGAGLTASTGTFAPNKYIKVTAGSGNLSFS